MGRIRKIACGAASSAAMGLLFIATPSIAQTRPPIMGKPIQRPAAVNPLSLITNSLSCDNGQTKHKELKSGVAIHVTPAQIFANGNGLLASIHRTFFFRASLPSTRIAKARLHIYAQPEPPFQPNIISNDLARLDLISGSSNSTNVDYSYSRCFGTACVNNHPSLTGTIWSQATVPQKRWISHDVQPALLQSLDSYVATPPFATTLRVETYGGPLVDHFLLETCHAPAGVDPFAPPEERPAGKFDDASPRTPPKT